jgi:hypothetical protein
MNGSFSGSERESGKSIVLLRFQEKGGQATRLGEHG